MKPKSKFIAERGSILLDDLRFHIPIWFMGDSRKKNKYFYIPVSQKFIELLSKRFAKSGSDGTRDDYFRMPAIIIDPDNNTIELPGRGIFDWGDQAGVWNFKTGRKKRIKKEK